MNWFYLTRCKTFEPSDVAECIHDLIKGKDKDKEYMKEFVRI